MNSCTIDKGISTPKSNETAFFVSNGVKPAANISSMEKARLDIADIKASSKKGQE